MSVVVPVESNAIAPQSGCSYPEPFKSRMGQMHWRPLGDEFGLTQFGISLETLCPGAESALRHWHTLEDEFLYMISGQVVLCNDDGEFPMTAGMCVGFKAGSDNAHHVVNHSDRDAQYLILGSRNPDDMAFYPDDDLAWVQSESGGLIKAHKDGTPYLEK